MERIVVGREVTVNSVYFNNKKNLETFPKEMEFEGETYTFLNNGWRYLVHKGQEVIRVFSVTDGKADYRLKLDPSESQWTLLDIQPILGA